MLYGDKDSSHGQAYGDLREKTMVFPYLCEWTSPRRSDVDFLRQLLRYQRLSHLLDDGEWVPLKVNPDSISCLLGVPCESLILS